MATDYNTKRRCYLREWREHRGLLQSDLGRMVGVAGNAISRYETGDRRIHISLQFKLAEALGITPAQLFLPAGTASLDDLAANATAAERRRLAVMVKSFLDGVGGE